MTDYFSLSLKKSILLGTSHLCSNFHMFTKSSVGGGSGVTRGGGGAASGRARVKATARRWSIGWMVCWPQSLWASLHTRTPFFLLSFPGGRHWPRLDPDWTNLKQRNYLVADRTMVIRNPTVVQWYHTIAPSGLDTYPSVAFRAVLVKLKYLQ